MFFWWGCPSLYFLIHNIYLNSSPTINYANLFLCTNAFFHFLIYSFNVTFPAYLFKYLPLNYFSFHFFVFILNITFSSTLTHSNVFHFTTYCFTTLWYVHIKILIRGITCFSTFSGFPFWKKAWMYLPFLFLYLFFYVQSFNYRWTLLPQLIFLIVCIKIKTSSRQLNVSRMKSKNIRLLFIASSYRTSMSYLSRLRTILYCSNNCSLFEILIHGLPISNGFIF